MSAVVDRYTALLRAASRAYEVAEHYSLDKIAEELLYLRETAAEVFNDFFFGSGRRAKRDYACVRARVERLLEELVQQLAARETVAEWELNELNQLMKALQQGGEAHG
jgi:ElaB/YqjD/DUF883 family membrane-anchored ribosome-binding protein